MLYEIREAKGKLPFKLFFRRKDGFKFKKAFDLQKYAECFADNYLSCCCLSCKERGWVYKTRGADGLRGGVRGPSRRTPQDDSIVLCPECCAKHLVQYEHFQIEQVFFDHQGRHTGIFDATRVVLSLIPD